MNHRYLCFAQSSCPRPPWCQDRTAPDQRSFNNVDPACELDARVVGCCSAKATASSPETRRFGPVRPTEGAPSASPPPLRLHLARARDRVGLRRSLVGEPPPLAPGPGVEGAGAQQPPRARAASPTRGVPAGNGTGHPPLHQPQGRTGALHALSRPLRNPPEPLPAPAHAQLSCVKVLATQPPAAFHLPPTPPPDRRVPPLWVGSRAPTAGPPSLSTDTVFFSLEQQGLQQHAGIARRIYLSTCQTRVPTRRPGF